jgi:trimeric autotransporter adhesin
VATAASASRAFGAANPTFTGTLTGVVNGDGITAGYTSQANGTTPAGAYSSGSYAITPVLTDPNNRLNNYNVTLNDGTLTITSGTGGSTTPYTLSANPTSLSMTTGQSSSFTLSLVPATSFAGTVTFACSGLPNGSSCSFAPASVTTDGTTTVQSTTVTIALPASKSNEVKAAGIFALPGILLGIFLLRKRKSFERALGVWILAAVFLVSAGIGCGAGNSNSGGSSVVGSYNALITATSPAATAQTLKIPVSLMQ